MVNSKSCLFLFLVHFFLLFLADARIAPSGPDPIGSPGPPPSMGNTYKVVRLVPTGPNPSQPPESPPSKDDAYQVQRLVPT